MSDNNDKTLKVCANCQFMTTEDDIYCRGCGCIFSGKPYEPRQDLHVAACLYGPPPIKRTHTCSCGFSWTSFSMIADERYCPKCGSKCTITGGRNNIR